MRGKRVKGRGACPSRRLPGPEPPQAVIMTENAEALASSQFEAPGPMAHLLILIFDDRVLNLPPPEAGIS